MKGKVPMPVPGNPETKGDPDGVSDAPGGGNIHGRSAGGESGGGAYPNPHTGKKPISGGFFSHGGQTEIGYHGGSQAGNDGEANSNAAARGGDNRSERDVGPKPGPTVPQSGSGSQTHEIAVEGRKLKVEEASGVAAAEATGKTGKAGQRTADPETAGSG